MPNRFEGGHIRGFDAIVPSPSVVNGLSFCDVSTVYACSKNRDDAIARAFARAFAAALARVEASSSTTD